MSSKKKKDESEVKLEKGTFNKGQILSSQKYRHKRDLINVLLKDGKSYTLKEVDDLIEKFMKGEVN